MTSPLLLPTGSVVQVRPPAPPEIKAAPPSSVTPVFPVPGLPGPAGTSFPVFNEVPDGDKDGVNLVFTTANSFETASTRVYRNGLREQLDYSYEETGPSEITFDEAPQPADDISIDYLIA